MILSTISFPGLGIEVDPNPVAFTAFGKPVYWYGIVIALGLVLAIAYGMRRSRQFGLQSDFIIDGVLVVLPAAIICARAYYCIFYWQLYRDNPISVLYIWEGGLAIYGGVIGAVAAILLYAKARKTPALPVLDLVSLGLLIGQCIGRWGNFFNREAHGSVTQCFLRMGLTNEAGTTVYYHPTFLYESVWNLMGFILLHFLSKKRKYDGQIFTMYIAWYGLGRAFIEGLRTDSLYLWNTDIRVSQLLAAVSCLVACGFLIYHGFLKKHDPKELYVNRKAQPVDDDAAEPGQDAPT